MSRDSSEWTGARPIWLALRSVGARLPIRERLRDLEQCLAGAALPGADVYYRTRTDTALVRLRADTARLSNQHLARLGRRASRIGASVIDVSALSRKTRTRFSRSYMCTYEVRFIDMPSAADGARMLAEYLGALPAGAGSASAALEGPPLRLRFRRGDCWQLGRVRDLTLESVAVAAGCPPRKDDRVEIELAAGDLEVVVDATVLAVTPPEAARLIGAYGFGARFVDLDAYSKRRLKRVLAFAEEQHALLERPPARRHPRYPVHWPIEIGVEGPDALVPALDISERGLFVACGTPVQPGTPLGITIPPEVREDPLHAGARVTRVLDAREASLRRVPPGFGLEITAMDAPAARRFADLVYRVARRARRCVLVGASPQRLPQLTAALSAVGYAVSCVSDPTSLVGRAGMRTPAADFAVLDWSLSDDDSGWIAAVQRHLRMRGTPSVVLHGEQANLAWQLADAALLG